jgi:Domain of unknown function (DUF4832)
LTASTRRRLAAATIALATTAAVALTSFVAAGSATAATAAPATKTFTKSVVSPTTDLANSLRGQYQWMGYPSQLSSPWRQPADVYYRDQVYWGRLERTKGAYDFSNIEAGLKKAGDAKGKFGFRVVAYCPGCWMELREDQTAFPPVTPTYLPVLPGTGTRYGPNNRLISTVPDWNNEAFLSRWEALWVELGKRYANDPRLGYVDVGGYGKFGEWWVDGSAPHITDANGLRMIKAVTSALPAKHVLINTMSPVKFTMAALTANPNLGIRTDSLGCPDMYSMVTDPVDTRLSEVWKTRPFFSEWGTTGDPVAGRAQVTKWHVSTTSSENMRLKYAAMTPTQQTAYVAAIRSAGYRYAVNKVTLGPILRGKSLSVTTTISNVGSAPTYDRWSVQLWLINSKGQKTWAKALPVDLRKILPGSKTTTTKVLVPSTLPKGTYTATIAVMDTLRYSAPMYLSSTPRRADGSYTLGTVVTG